jgi:dihydrofolate synthase/folylpolyglutamate synthase
MYQRVGKVAYKKDLTNTIALLDALDNPHRKFKSVHIAGTNGKGTSAHAIAAILQVAGYKTGLYTSPHLKRFTERIKINGEEIGEEEVLAFTSSNRELIDRIQPSFFEVTVAMAFNYFANQQVDIAVIETGLGGRLDSTNVITPEVSLITNIGFDHMDLLGDTLPKIAFEKAGIIKPGISAVIGDMVPEAVEVMLEVSEERGSKLHLTFEKEIPDIKLTETPPYFKRNVPGVLGVIDELKQKEWHISDDAVTEGLENFIALTNMKGRFQKLQDRPTVVADVSHNPDGLRILFDHVRSLEFGQLHLIFGSVIDKDLKPIFETFPDKCHLYFTSSHVPRKLDAQILQNEAKVAGFIGDAFDDVNDAIKDALAHAKENDLILITGSTFVVAEINEL